MDERTAKRIFEMLATLYARQQGMEVEKITVTKKASKDDDKNKVTA